MHVDLAHLPGGVPGSLTPTQLVDRLTDRILHPPLSAADRSQLIAYASIGVPANRPIGQAAALSKTADVAALLLDSPYFQLR